MNWIDTHCHLDAPEFDTDRSAVLSRARAGGVAMLVLPAVQAAQVPEHAAVARPAWSPKVPAGHNEQTAAPASE